MSNISSLDRPDATTAVPPLPHEADRRRRLTVMRRWATGTLAAVSLLWLAVVLVQPSGDWGPYGLAALEASMVGALADWFAVVALFRRPLRHRRVAWRRLETVRTDYRGVAEVVDRPRVTLQYQWRPTGRGKGRLKRSRRATVRVVRGGGAAG